MALLQLALERERWDLAAHAIVLATARILNKGDKPDADKKKKRAKKQPKQ